MLMAEAEGCIRIKVGLAANPIARLADLLCGCPVAPEVMAVAELQNRKRAYACEQALHQVLARWHWHREWFSFNESDREEFNAAWRKVFTAFSTPSKRVKWKKLSVEEIIAGRQARQAASRHSYGRAGDAGRDFLRHVREDP